MDNMAVTISAGCTPHQGIKPVLFQISLLFALAHFMMFSLGFEGGVLVHAGRKAGAGVACLLLVIIGIRMITESFKEPEIKTTIFTSFQMQLTLAVATSLDALFVGAGMALTQLPFWQTVSWVTGCVFVTSLGGFYIGHLLGKKLGNRMEKTGGCLLILLGVKVLLDGLGIL